MTDPTPAALWQTWRDAANITAVDQAIRALYEEVDQAIRDAPRDLPQGPPTCNASGRCCKFDSFGHRLYVTGLEIAWFLGRVSGAGSGVSTESRDIGGEASSVSLPVIESTRDEQSDSDKTQDPELKTPIPDACRYQLEGLCSTHNIRPLGCRIYFCTPGTDDWQHAVYERFLSQLQQLHKEHGLPYRYMEWRAGLVEADGFLG